MEGCPSRAGPCVELETQQSRARGFLFLTPAAHPTISGKEMSDDFDRLGRERVRLLLETGC